ncbi:MAG: DUF4199 domain-containing protein [Saprospiraceae bacterium]|nr:DUF4199 domain-containing protein [Saprospiraceae bacterium]
MKKTVLTYGIASGLICAVWMAGFIAMGKFQDFENGMIYGYASMIIAFSLIFVAIHQHKKNYGNGHITFKTAFMIGFYITLIASTMYVLTWLYCYFNVIPDFFDNYLAYSLEKMKADKASTVEIEAYAKQMDDFKESYKNPIFNGLITYTEILPVGLLISLISALILRTKSVR